MFRQAQHDNAETYLNGITLRQAQGDMVLKSLVIRKGTNYSITKKTIPSYEGDNFDFTLRNTFLAK